MDIICRMETESSDLDRSWSAKVGAQDLSIFGKPLRQGDGCHIIGIQNPKISENVLEFSAGQVVLFNLGSGDRAVFIDLASSQAAIAHRKQTKPSSLDDAFLQACAAENLPNDKIILIREFLAAVRSYSDDELVEGKARKWVTSPINFLAITIQNTKKRFAINLKDTPSVRSLEGIDVLPDRPGHVRFILENKSQLEDAIIAAGNSFASSKRR